MGHIDLQHPMELLGKEKIDSVLLEGGGTLNWAALEAGIVQKVQAYIAPKLLGNNGQDSRRRKRRRRTGSGISDQT
mgnify:FL=1